MTANSPVQTSLPSAKTPLIITGVAGIAAAAFCIYKKYDFKKSIPVVLSVMAIGLVGGYMYAMSTSPKIA